MSLHEKRNSWIEAGLYDYNIAKKIENTKIRQPFADETEAALQKSKIGGGVGLCTSFGTNLDAKVRKINIDY